MRTNPAAALLKQLASAPASRGKSNLAKHLAGERLTQRQAILAKCCDCMGHHVDGRFDCGIGTCPLYAWMPYRARPETPRPVRQTGGVVASERGSGPSGTNPSPHGQELPRAD